MRAEEPFWRRYLRFLGSDVDADIDDELDFHLAMRERDFAAAGLDPGRAREAALASFGDYEEVKRWLRAHDRRGSGRQRRLELFSGVDQDVRFGLRKLRKQPGFTAAAVMILALGIGATTAIFSALDALLLRPLPFAEDERLVVLPTLTPSISFPGMPEGKYAPDPTDLDAHQDVFRTHTTAAWGTLNLTDAGDPIRVRIAMVTSSFFSTLGVATSVGRPFTREEGEPGSPRSAILAESLARRRFGSADQAVGRAIQLHGREYEVVGVMPIGFAYPHETDVWLPLPVPMRFEDREAFRQFTPSITIARLAPGVTLQDADRRVRTIYASYGGRSAERAQESVAMVVPVREQLVGERRGAVLLLFGATLLVLLVACANVANLLLARAAARRPEIGMRRVLGAKRWRIAQQLGIESLLLAGLGGAGGILLAFLAMRPLRTLIPPHLAGTLTLGVDPRVLAFALVLVLVTSMGFGLWPILGLARARTTEAVRSDPGRQTVGRDTARIRRGLVVAEIAIALMLLVGATVMLRSFSTLLSVDPGIQAERVATLELTLAAASYGRSEERRAFVGAVLARLEADPRVESAAFINELPLRGDGGISIGLAPEGYAGDRSALPFTMSLNISGDYFRTMGIPLLRGRSFRGTGGAEEGQEVVVNQLLAELFWPGEDPIGKRIPFPTGTPLEVVGVVGNVKGRSLDLPLAPQMYQSMAESPYPHLALVGRSRGDSDAATAALVEAVRAVDPAQAVYNVKSMGEVIAGPLAPRRTNTLLIGIFGLIATALATIGVYAVLAYEVVQRSRELGIRMALGAASSRILRQVVGEGFTLAIVGSVLGLAGAWAAVRLLESLLYETTPRDPFAFAAAPLLLLGVALAATYLPARRAARIDPAAMIRAE